MNQLTEMLIRLTECRLSVSEWLEWWDKNQMDLEAELSHAEYIRLKPKFREGPILYRILEASQAGAEIYLKKRKISYVPSCFYKEESCTDWEEYRKNRGQEARAEKVRNQQKRDRLLKNLAGTDLSEMDLGHKSASFFSALSSLAQSYDDLGA